MRRAAGHDRRRRCATAAAAPPPPAAASLSGSFGRRRRLGLAILRSNDRRRGGALNNVLGCGFIDDDALERARAPLVELQPAGERLDAHFQVLQLDAAPRHLDYEVVEELVVQLIDGPPGRFTL